MQLATLFQALAFGPLNNLSLGGCGTGVVPVEQHRRLASLVQTALGRLYTDFVLAEEDLTLVLRPSRVNYRLHPDHAYTNEASGAEKYIHDSPFAPFDGEVIKVTAVYDELGRDVPLNDRKFAGSVFTPEHDVLQVPTPDADVVLSVICQMKHPQLLTADPADVVDLGVEVHIPPALEEALIGLTTYYVYSSMNGEENTAKGAEWLGTYQQQVSKTKDENLLGRSSTESATKFHARGFK